MHFQSRCINSTELLITLALSFVLSVIHSQIVATTVSSATASRKKRAGSSLLPRRKHTKDRIRRKRRTRPGSGGTTIVVGNVRVEESGGYPVGVVTRSGGNTRNVNWDSPIKVHFEIGNQPMPTPTAAPGKDKEDDDATGGLRRRRRGQCKDGGDDGFESLNGKSSSGEESHLSEQMRTTGDDGSLISDLPAEDGVDDERVGTVGGGEREQKQPKIKGPFVGAKGKGDHSDTDEEREDENDLNLSSPGRNSSGAFTEGTNSNAEWCGVTTNSEECSYSSDLEHTDSQDFAPTVILNANCGAMDRSE